MQPYSGERQSHGACERTNASVPFGNVGTDADQRRRQDPASSPDGNTGAAPALRRQRDVQAFFDALRAVLRR